MHKNRTFLLAGFLAVYSVGCATIQQRDSTQFHVIPISQMIENPSKWQDIGKEINDGKEIIFMVSKGQQVPLKLKTETPIGTVEKSENTFTFNRDAYLLISKAKMQISPDGQRWANIGSMRSLKKLFDFNKGQISVGFQATKEAGTFISLDVNAK